MKNCLFAAALAATIASAASASPLTHSFENATNGWYAPNANVTLTPVQIGDGAPAASITEGTYSLRGADSASDKFIEVARMNTDGAPDFFAAITDASNESISIDFHVPATSTPGQTFAQVFLYFAYKINSGSTQFLDSSINIPVEQDVSGTVEVDLTSIAADLPNLTFAQVTLATNGNDMPAATTSPVFLDNFQVHAVPEPATLCVTLLGAVLVTARRRRR